MLPPVREPSRSLSTRGSALLARFDECGPAVVEPSPVLPPVREPSRSLSTRGSALLARFDECGPAVVEPTAPPSGYDPVVPDGY